MKFFGFLKIKLLCTKKFDFNMWWQVKPIEVWKNDLAELRNKREKWIKKAFIYVWAYLISFIKITLP